MESSSHFNLFRRRLLSFGSQTHDLPISLRQPLLVAFSPNMLDTTSYLDEDKDLREVIEDVIVDIQKRSGKNPYLDVVFMYYFVLSSDVTIDIMIKHIKQYVSAAQVTNNYSEQRDNRCYWLSNWHPERMMQETEYYQALIECKDIWIKETDDLRLALMQVNHPKFFLPDDYFGWDVLEKLL